jgi:hypothetical protein
MKLGRFQFQIQKGQWFGPPNSCLLSDLSRRLYAQPSDPRPTSTDYGAAVHLFSLCFAALKANNRRCHPISERFDLSQPLSSGPGAPPRRKRIRCRAAPCSAAWCPFDHFEIRVSILRFELARISKWSNGHRAALHGAARQLIWFPSKAL